MRPRRRRQPAAGNGSRPGTARSGRHGASPRAGRRTRRPRAGPAHDRHRSDPGSWTGCCSGTTSSSGSTTCRRRRPERSRCASTDISAVMEVLDVAYDEGVRTFMCTTHDRIAEVCQAGPAESRSLRRDDVLPVHAVRPQVRQRDHRRRLPGGDPAIPARRGTAGQRGSRHHVAGPQGHRRRVDVADRRRAEDVRRPGHAGDLDAERGDRPVAGSRLHRGVPDLRRPRAQPVRCRSRASSP